MDPQQRRQEIRNLVDEMTLADAREALLAVLEVAESAQEKPDVTCYHGSRSHEVVDAEYAARHDVADDVDLSILTVLEEARAKRTSGPETPGPSC